MTTKYNQMFQVPTGLAGTVGQIEGNIQQGMKTGQYTSPQTTQGLAGSGVTGYNPLTSTQNRTLDIRGLINPTDGNGLSLAASTVQLSDRPKVLNEADTAVASAEEAVKVPTPNTPEAENQNDLSHTKGMNPYLAGGLAIGELATGIAGTLSNIKVQKEQIKGLKQNRAIAAENQQRRKAMGDSWAAGWNA